MHLDITMHRPLCGATRAGLVDNRQHAVVVIHVGDRQQSDDAVGGRRGLGG